MKKRNTMETKKWIEAVSRGGGVCADYMRKLSSADSKDDLFRVLCDANGGEWLFGVHAKGVPVPVEVFMSEFANLVDGKRVVSYPKGYTSKFYCRYSGELVADTTLVYLLECKDVKITVNENSFPAVMLSDGSCAEILVKTGARLNIHIYGDASYNVTGDTKYVRVAKH